MCSSDLGPAAQSLLTGDTQVMFATSPTVMGFIKGNRMRPLAISMRKASPSIPGIPGSDEVGPAGFESTFWFGLYAPAGTPADIVRRVHAAALKGLSKPEVREKIQGAGIDLDAEDAAVKLDLCLPRHLRAYSTPLNVSSIRAG